MPSLSPEAMDLLRKANETNEQIVGLLSHLNDVPLSAPVDDVVRKAVAAGDGTDADATLQRRIMSLDQMDEIRQSLRTKSLRELHVLFAKQASRRDTGVPLYEWLSAGGAPLGNRWSYGGGLSSKVEPQIAKALDSSGASALIRQDLEPILYEIFVKVFPLADAIPTEPANGLVHAYDKQTSFGQAQWIGELDTVVDDRGSYERAFTNIGILATRRGVSLKSQFAVLAGGAGFNPERLELQAGMRAMTASLQSAIAMGNWLDNTGTANNEKGPFDADSIDGFRKSFNASTAINVDPFTNPDTTGSLRRAIDHAIQPIIDAGGAPSAVYGSVTDLTTFNEQQEAKERIVITDTGRDVVPGETIRRVRTVAGDLPYFTVPGGYIGAYTPDVVPGGWTTARDLYVIDPDTISRPYLGSAGPTVLEIPIGVSGQLTHLFIIFMMTGLKIAVPTWNNKIRVKAS